MFDHLEITAVEMFATQSELLDEKIWHKDVWGIIDYFFKINKDDADLKRIRSVYPGLQYMIYRDLTLYYERCDVLPARKRKIVEHIINTLGKYHDAGSVVLENSIDIKKDCTVVPFKKPLSQ